MARKQGSGAFVRCGIDDGFSVVEEGGRFDDGEWREVDDGKRGRQMMGSGYPHHGSSQWQQRRQENLLQQDTVQRKVECGKRDA